jgi:hypothetical protein
MPRVLSREGLAPNEMGRFPIGCLARRDQREYSRLLLAERSLTCCAAALIVAGELRAVKVKSKRRSREERSESVST